MKKYEHIVSLVDKLRNDNLSPEELGELQLLFHSAEAQGDVEMWLVDLWKSSGMMDDCHSLDSGAMLRKLREKIEIPEQADTTSRFPPVRRGTVDYVHVLMRYAAVFLLAAALSWFWFGRGKQTATTIAETDASQFVGVSEISVTHGSKSRIVLPDSSVVYLNSGSRLTYPAVFDRERHVTLVGEGYFIVRSDSLQPFLVHTTDVSVKALGTEFNVKAYPEEGNVETYLVKGAVEIIKKGQAKPIIELKPGEKGSYVKETATLEQIVVAASDKVNVDKEKPVLNVSIVRKPDISTGWVKNQLVFDAEPFEQIAVRLERWFNVEIEIRNATLSKTRLTGRYDTENIEQVMHSLQMVTPFSYKIVKNKIIIK